MKKTKLKGFTLIELLVVIAIIGLLATLSVIALNNARAKARDAKRLADIKQFQTALELYFNAAGHYPSAAEIASGQLSYDSGSGTTTYMQVIPAAPTPADGNCTDSNNSYSYTSDGASYAISFCVAQASNDLGGGDLVAFPGGIHGGSGGGDNNTPTCSCSDIAAACCSSCAAGSLCGGGTVALAGSSPLIAAPSGCTGTDGSGCGLSNTDSSIFKWEDPALAYRQPSLWESLHELLIPAAEAAPASCPSCTLTGANSNADGRVNVTAMKAVNGGTLANRFVAAKFCDDLVVNGFSDWYLPSTNEMESVFQAGDQCASGYSGVCSISDPGARIIGLSNSYYWSSTETAYDKANFMSNASAASINVKNLEEFVHCVRR